MTVFVLEQFGFRAQKFEKGRWSTDYKVLANKIL